MVAGGARRRHARDSRGAARAGHPCGGGSGERRAQRHSAALPAPGLELAAFPHAASDSAPASPTTWVSARPFRCWRCCFASVTTARRGHGRRPCWWFRRRCSETGATKRRALRRRSSSASSTRRRRIGRPWRVSRKRPRSVYVAPTWSSRPTPCWCGRPGSRRCPGGSSFWTRRRPSRTRPRGRVERSGSSPRNARIALTGTPVENRLGDLWSIFDFLNPGLLGFASGVPGLR